MDQSRACYLWTYAIAPDHNILSLPEAQALVRHAWAFYRPTEAAPVVLASMSEKYAKGLRYSLHLPVWARTKTIILHEAAHSLSLDDQNQSLDDGYLGHGPLFMRSVIDLYAMFLGLDRNQLGETAREHGLIIS